MIRDAGRDRIVFVLVLLALALVAGAGSVKIAVAQPAETPQQFWHIPVWAQAGSWQDSTGFFPRRCGGSFTGPQPDSLHSRARTVTVRFLRNRRVEARSDFGGYRIYRVVGTPDTAAMVLLRRFSLNTGATEEDKLLWHFSRVDTASLQFLCGASGAHDSVVTFVDPDSCGAFTKICRRVDEAGRCLSRGDSIWTLRAPSGPHDGFRLWYSVTYEARNVLDNNYEDLFVPDTSDAYARCGKSGDRSTCPNLNHKAANMIAEPVEATAGPTADLQTVTVVPNPFRAQEAWDRPGGNEVHFINLPQNARIRVYTVSGDLVRELNHQDPLRDFERWDLKNADGNDVASGIYVYRVEAGAFSLQNRFVVIR